MKHFIYSTLLLLASGQALAALGPMEDSTRIKDVARLTEARENALVGYGIVTGLAGTGDSTRSQETFQSISNLLRNFGVNMAPTQVRGRNAASVMVTANLPAFARRGARIDVNVASLGDARSLVGGTLLLAHMVGPDGQIYALAQGPISVGGFSYDLNGNMVQKNHPTTGSVPDGAVIERELLAAMLNADGEIDISLVDPDFTTASRVVEAINVGIVPAIARAIDAGRVAVQVPDGYRSNLVGLVTRIENLTIEPDRRARVVVNERTGTVVAGGDVKVSQISVTHGDLKVFISSDYSVSQPVFVADTGAGVRTEIIPDTSVTVSETDPVTVSVRSASTVADLVSALNKVKATSRDIIAILQAVKRAGALHAELIIQ